MKRHTIKSWLESIVQDKRKFIFYFGILFMGGSWFLGMTALSVVQAISTDSPLIKGGISVLATLLVSPLVGWLWALWMWYYFEWTRRRRNKQDTP